MKIQQYVRFGFTFKSKRNSKMNRTLFFAGLFLLFNLVVIGQANAQYRCSAFNFSPPDSQTRLNGIWKIEHANNAGILHTTILTMKGWGGVSITSYYDSSERRTRNIAQNHLLCMRKDIMVIVGFLPFDSDTGEKVSTYGADNFILSRDRSGNIIGINFDDNQNGSTLKITFLSNLSGTSQKTKTRKKTKKR